MIQKSIPKRLLGLAAIAVLAVACSTPGGSAAPSSAPAASESASAAGRVRVRSASAAAQFKIGYSNGGGVGNGFREEQVCTAKAEALASGQVSELVTYPPQHGRGRPAGGHPRPDRGRRRRDRLQPERSGGAQPGARRGQGRRASRPSRSTPTSPNPDTYNLYNNQIEYAKLGAKWLFEQLGGEGTVYYMRGLAGHPADTDRDIGFKKVLADYPGIKVVPNADGVAHRLGSGHHHDPDQRLHRAAASTTTSTASGRPAWTRRSSTPSRRAGKQFVPIVGADLGAFVNQLLDETTTRASRARR